MPESIGSPQSPRSAPPSTSEFMIAWICAIDVEYSAVLEVLDEEYDRQGIRQVDHDYNAYTLGRIGLHSVVIVVPPTDATGTVHAAAVAGNLRASFPSIRYALMVGIGGGVPTEGKDIRLGDVVVGTRVVPYRFGQERTDGFHCTGHSKPAPAILRAKATELQVRLRRGELNIQQSIDAVRGRNEIVASYFSRPENDCLFRQAYPHQTFGGSCQRCVVSSSTTVMRNRRQVGQTTVVHGGAVASADQVMKDAKMRDDISMQQGTICFEMESVGIMQQLDCVPIRGISDYADSHKNDEWQPYAALSAAVCAKMLLSLLYPNEISGITMKVTPEDMHRFVEMAVKTSEKLRATGETVALHTSKIQETTEVVNLIQDRLDVIDEWFKNIKTSDAEDDIRNTRHQVEQIQKLDRELKEALETVNSVVDVQKRMTTDFVTRDEWRALEARVNEQETRLNSISKNTSQAMVLTSEVLASAEVLSGDTRLGPISELLRIGSRLPDLITSFYSGFNSQPSLATSRTPRFPQLNFQPRLPTTKMFQPSPRTAPASEESMWNRMTSRLRSSERPEQPQPQHPQQPVNNGERTTSPGREKNVHRPQGSREVIEELAAQQSRLNDPSRRTPPVPNRTSPSPRVRPPVPGRKNVRRFARN